MSENKKMVEAITPINEDFAQWYTDICLKAELVDYSAVKGCGSLRPYGYLFQRACCKRKKTMERALRPRWRG